LYSSIDIQYNSDGFIPNCLQAKRERGLFSL